MVASTATGQTLAKVTVPGMELTVYSAAANDSTFLVGEFKPKGRFPSGFVLARFHPQTQAITLTPVALRPATAPGSLFWYTLSPDAAKVAISRYVIDGQRGVRHHRHPGHRSQPDMDPALRPGPADHGQYLVRRRPAFRAHLAELSFHDLRALSYYYGSTRARRTWPLPAAACHHPARSRSQPD